MALQSDERRWEGNSTQPERPPPNAPRQTTRQTNANELTQHRAASNLLGALEGVVVARNVRHNRTFIRFRSVDQIYSIGIDSFLFD